MLRVLENRRLPEEETKGPLEGEIEALRAAMKTVKRRMDDAAYSGEGDDGDVAKMGALLARLSDSVVRAVLAQHKLAAGNDSVASVREELDHALKVLWET